MTKYKIKSSYCAKKNRRKIVIEISHICTVIEQIKQIFISFLLNKRIATRQKTKTNIPFLKQQVNINNIS